MEAKNILILAAGVGIGYLIFKEMNKNAVATPTPVPPVPTPMPEPAQPTMMDCPLGKTSLNLGGGKFECVPNSGFVINPDTKEPDPQSFILNQDFTATYKLNYPPFETRVVNFIQGDMFDGFVYSEYVAQNGEAVQNFYATTTTEGNLPEIEMSGQIWLSIPLNLLTIA
jgi:hypothetical protein